MEATLFDFMHKTRGERISKGFEYAVCVVFFIHFMKIFPFFSGAERICLCVLYAHTRDHTVLHAVCRLYHRRESADNIKRASMLDFCMWAIPDFEVFQFNNNTNKIKSQNNDESESNEKNAQRIRLRFFPSFYLLFEM